MEKRMEHDMETTVYDRALARRVWLCRSRDLRHAFVTCKNPRRKGLNGNPPDFTPTGLPNHGKAFRCNRGALSHPKLVGGPLDRT